MGQPQTGNRAPDPLGGQTLQGLSGAGGLSGPSGPGTTSLATPLINPGGIPTGTDGGPLISPGTGITGNPAAPTGIPTAPGGGALINPGTNPTSAGGQFSGAGGQQSIQALLTGLFGGGAGGGNLGQRLFGQGGQRNRAKGG